MSTLYVPVHLDALVCEHPREVVGPTADFEVLPWFDGKRDRYPGTANVASSINAEPFADHSMYLQPGVHLHWTLPPGLTRGTSDPAVTDGIEVGGLRFPPAPNRWFVTATTDTTVEGDEPSWTERSWIVESDYVHPPDAQPERAVAYPLNDDIIHSDRLVRGRRYVHLGRQIPVAADGWAADAHDIHLPDIDAPLTALGHLEPTFAALYANCHSIFGAHDAEVPTGIVSYHLVGWYSDDVADPLTEFRARMDGRPRHQQIARLNAERVRSHESSEEPGPLDLLADDAELTGLDRLEALRLAIADRFGWDIDPSDTSVPERMVCYGALTVDVNGIFGGDTSLDVDSTSILHGPIGVGNSSTEALAAYIAADSDAPLLEEQLEAVHLGTAPDHHALDLQSKFREGRHSLQFVESGRRRLWTIRAAASSGSNGAEERDIPDTVLTALDELDKAQHEFDLAADAVGDARQQTFSDWHRSMTLAYAPTEVGDESTQPQLDVDELHAMIDQRDLAPLESAVRDLGALRFFRDDVARWRVKGDQIGWSSASRLAERVSEVQHLLDDWDTAHDYELALVPGPRFFRPRDPVVCLHHPTLTASRRYGSGDAPTAQEGPLPVRLGEHPVPELFDVATAMRMLLATVHEVMNARSRPIQGASSWNPLLLEWQAEVEAVGPNGNHRSAGATYDSEFVRIHYSLPDSQPDLAERSNPALAPTKEYLSGRTILHPGTAERLADDVDATIQRLTAAGTPVPENLQATVGTLRDGTYSNVLTQSLGGFHDGLCMLLTDRQLRVDDPIGFAAQRARAGRVRDALGDLVPATPRPDAPFHPIRSGEMSIQRLRIVDTFGQTVEWRPRALYASRPYRHDIAAPNRERRPDRCVLPLRVSQGARIDARWLRADDIDVESTHHAATSPVLGWFLTNELDGALFVYDADGDLLGSIGSAGHWRSAPGAEHPVLSPHDIANGHLAQRVAWITDAENPATAVEGMIDAIDTAMESIDPVDAAQHSSRALLVGRPVALVRARVQLQLQGLASSDQSWEALRRRTLGLDGLPTDHGFTSVLFPIRIGGHDQLNDGVVGFWAEPGHGPLAQHFVTSHGSHVDSGDVENRTAVHADMRVDLDDGLLWRSFDDEPLTVSMLIDPRAAMHLTTGILPVKTLTVPPAQFAAALASMRVTFPTMPILTPADSVTLALPNEPGYSWAWLQRQGADWTETPEEPTIDMADFARAFPADTDARWHDLIERGTLRLVGASGRRARLVLPGPNEPDLYPKLLKALNTVAKSVRPASLGAEFTSRSVIRDGWLQLRPLAKVDAALPTTPTETDPEEND